MDLNASRNVRVYNDGNFDHEEKFRGDLVRIKSRDFIVMDYGDAVLFKGQFFPPKFDKGGLQTEKSYKRIRLDEIPAEKEVKTVSVDSEKTLEHICQACGFKAKSLAGLKGHIRANHKDQMIDEDARDSL